MDRVTIIITVLITIVITAALTILSAFGGGFASNSAGAASNEISVPIYIHLFTAGAAAFLGPFIVFRKKGDARHKLLGRIWASLMIITAITSVFIRSPGQGIAGTGFSYIHIFTVWTLVNVPLAIWAIRNGNVRAHRGAMLGLYLGLLIAGGFTFLPGRLLGNLVFG